MELTKDADKMICCIYKSYLQRRKDGLSKAVSRRFEDSFFSSEEHLSTWVHEDITETRLELGRSGLIKNYIGGDFMLTDSGIIYMESRFKNNLIAVTDFISKLLPFCVLIEIVINSSTEFMCYPSLCLHFVYFLAKKNTFNCFSVILRQSDLDFVSRNSLPGFIHTKC